MKIITFAIPFFLVLLVLEAIYSKASKKNLFAGYDTFANLGCGIAEQTLGLFVKVIILAAYFFIYENFRLFEVSMTSVVAWVAAFFVIDMIYYWFHRIAHRVNAIWCTHAVHHQSEYYNLSVALRQSLFQSWFSWPLFLPLALIGVPPEMYITCYAINLVYQFWVHTEVVRTLGPLELFMNTPSHHRVHHGKNKQYIDKNYAGVFIIWDKLFGTFEPEVEKVQYGITLQIHASNPVFANFHPWQYLVRDARNTKSFVDKLRLWFMPNGWRPKDCTTPHVEDARPERPSYSLLKSLEIWGSFAVVVVVTLALLEGRVEAAEKKVAAAVAVFLLLISIGKKFDTLKAPLLVDLLWLGLLGYVLI